MKGGGLVSAIRAKLHGVYSYLPRRWGGALVLGWSLGMTSFAASLLITLYVASPSGLTDPRIAISGNIGSASLIGSAKADRTANNVCHVSRRYSSISSLNSALAYLETISDD